MRMSRGSSGVAAAAWYERIHLTDASTGQSDSPSPSCMVVVASKVGAMKCR